jgi:hypothetical protein
VKGRAAFWPLPQTKEERRTFEPFEKSILYRLFMLPLPCRLLVCPHAAAQGQDALTCVVLPEIKIAAVSPPEQRTFQK